MAGKNIIIIALGLVCWVLAIAHGRGQDRMRLGTLYATARRRPLLRGPLEWGLAVAAILLGVLGLVV